MPGQGILKGMVVTLVNFIATYPWGPGLLKAFGIHANNGMFTVEYPEVQVQPSERFRYFPFLVYDEKPDNLRCVACKICEQECPPQCIYIEMEKDDKARPVKANGRTFPKRFDIDVSVCMSCRICVDVCPFDAIEMDNKFELGAYDRFQSLMLPKDQLLKSSEYFTAIKPTEAATVNARLAAKAKKAAPAPAVPAATAQTPAAPPSPASPPATP